MHLYDGHAAGIGKQCSFAVYRVSRVIKGGHSCRQNLCCCLLFHSCQHGMNCWAYWHPRCWLVCSTCCWLVYVWSRGWSCWLCNKGCGWWGWAWYTCAIFKNVKQVVNALWVVVSDSGIDFGEVLEVVIHMQIFCLLSWVSRSQVSSWDLNMWIPRKSFKLVSHCYQYWKIKKIIGGYNFEGLPDFYLVSGSMWLELQTCRTQQLIPIHASCRLRMYYVAGHIDTIIFSLTAVHFGVNFAYNLMNVYCMWIF